MAERSTLLADEKVISLKSELANIPDAIVIVLVVPIADVLKRSLLVTELPDIVCPFKLRPPKPKFIRIALEAMLVKLSPSVTVIPALIFTFGINLPPVVMVLVARGEIVDVACGV